MNGQAVIRRLHERLEASRLARIGRAAVRVGLALARAARRAPGAAARVWTSVRPRTGRGAAIGLAAIVGGSTLLAVLFLVGATVAWSPYVESVVHPDANARTWAALDPTYTDQNACTECHRPEAARAASAGHAEIGCESCHGALREHALAKPGTPEASIGLATPTDELCVRCHASAAGRPASIRQIAPSDHYVAVCLQCHDPHTAISRRPPVVEHTLVNLPPCVTCHGPDGFKARNQRHPTVEGDASCLDCHAAGRGPEDD